MSNLVFKLGQIGPKCDKSGTFKISFSTFWLNEPKYTETDLKSPRFVQFGANLTQFGCQICHLCGGVENLRFTQDKHPLGHTIKPANRQQRL